MAEFHKSIRKILADFSKYQPGKIGHHILASQVIIIIIIHSHSCLFVYTTLVQISIQLDKGRMQKKMKK